jgi:hypothetical protein
VSWLAVIATIEGVDLELIAFIVIIEAMIGRDRRKREVKS